MTTASHIEHLHDPASGEACHCGESHSHVQVQLRQTLMGLVFVINSFLVNWLFERNGPVAAFSALLASIPTRLEAPNILRAHLIRR